MAPSQSQFQTSMIQSGRTTVSEIASGWKLLSLLVGAATPQQHCPAFVALGDNGEKK